MRGVDVELNVGEEMSHVYPLYPLGPDQKRHSSTLLKLLTILNFYKLR
ncbi:MAG: hypothetical protein ILA26_08740 [Methanobrevibacter sp.]|nr:hypothetical protein [Methanobrevibacter sp.]MBP3792104.1 hypothetical protein [Methanobrevibacter sp.]